MTLKNSLFGTWSFYKRFLAVAIPVMMQQLIQNLVSLIDNFMVAGLGDIKMSGVNIAGQIFFNFFVILNTICASAGIFMSQFKGAKKQSGMQQTFKFKLIVCGLCGIFFTVLCFIAPRNLFGLMVKNNSDAPEILDYTVLYSRAVALSWIFAILSQCIATSLREIEIVRPPLVISISATLVNTFLNWVLIYGNLGAPKLEVVGAAYATVIARIVELIAFSVYAIRTKPEFLFKIKEFFHIDFNLFGTIIKKSGMILYSEVFWAVSETISNALYNTRGGAEVVSGMASGFAIANLIFICMGGIVTSTGVIIGQELGANHIEECKKYKNWILSGSVFMGLFFMFIGLSTTFLVNIVFNNLTLESRTYARELIIIASVYLPLWAFLNGQYSISRTGGDTTMGVLCDTVGNILFIGGMLILTFCTDFNPVLMYAIVKFSDLPKTLIAHFWLKKERWLVNLT